MVNKPFIFQVVGYQNSGKTTAVTQIVRGLSEQGYKVATIKHHGHGGKPEVVKDKDSYRHIDAGAIVTLVEGNGRLLLQGEKSEWSLAEKITLISQMNPDFIIIEGHKFESYPKLVLIRKHEDTELLTKLTCIKAIYFWDLEFMNANEVQEDLLLCHLKEDDSFKRVIRFMIDECKNVFRRELE
ncbi:MULTISPECIES: molybdopterin-guanine dinucleotide biosynthesis protein B [unclassified Bacillus (in: firmicutes)]|uniref:molybdopterin-guanine dinucleotide biosynthesis protein B n=1 Tax=unclassified Bacillus (in: firmicutes) TaxID=185979 RepID=UPI000AFA7EC6|nr:MULTISPECIES: molybdopterin-guanine dinucleotide biosynthesis protein B [unclassified Bacillus (in: firmicutes)]